jgi:hypothetical protein
VAGVRDLYSWTRLRALRTCHGTFLALLHGSRDSSRVSDLETRGGISILGI